MPITPIANIKAISKKLPLFVERRIPPKEIRDKFLDVVSSDEGSNILRYIKMSNCVTVTDNFKINLT